MELVALTNVKMVITSYLIPKDAQSFAQGAPSLMMKPLLPHASDAASIASSVKVPRYALDVSLGLPSIRGNVRKW